MQLAHCYYKCAKICEAKFRYILRLFALDLTASDTVRLTGLSVRSVNDICRRLTRHLQQLLPVPTDLYGAVELDESYIGPRRVRDKHGCGAGGKTIVFSVCKHGGQVWYGNRPKLSEKDLVGHYLGQNRRIGHGQYRWLSRLRRVGRCGLWPPLSRAPRPRRVCPGCLVHQRH